MGLDLVHIVIPPEHGEAWWQPRPAGGYVVIKTVTPGHLAMGTQEIDPGGRVPRHRHPQAQEVLFVYEGHGLAYIDDTEVTLFPGITLVMPPNVWHSFVNNTEAPLRLTWSITPSGLEGMFRLLGRPKHGNAPRPPDWPPPTAAQVAQFPATFGIERALTS